MHEGVRVKSAFPIAGSEDRMVLFSWTLSDEPRLQNVARLDRQGIVLWRAELPGDAAHDCFVSLQRAGGRFVARTYSGRELELDVELPSYDLAQAA